MKHLKVWLCCLLSLFAFAEVTSAQTTTYVAGEVLVKFKTGISAQTSATLHTQVGATVMDTLPQIGWQRVRVPAGKTVEQAVAEYKAIANVALAAPNYP